MCCWTHGDLEAYPGELAASDNWRCRCAAAPPCPRKADGEAAWWDEPGSQDAGLILPPS